MTIVENLRYFLTRRHRPKGGSKTSLILWVTYFCWNTFKKVKSAIILAGYSSRTIAAYFRKQGAQIGEDCDILITHLGPEPYLISIGNHVFISPGVYFHTHDGGVWVFRDKIPGIRVYGTITIEDNCLIGRDVQLLPNIRIGRNSIVGAGSVVVTDVPPNSIVMGIPARVISSNQKYEEKCLAKWNEQKLPDLPFNADYGWWLSQENKKKLRRHLMNMFKDQGKSEKETDK